MADRPRLLLALALPTLLFTSDPVLAGWPHGLNEIVLSGGVGDRTSAKAATDGSGGMIAAWVDSRSGGSDIYAQRVRADGTSDWALNGVPVCTFAGNQVLVSVIEDGSGGVFVAWEDHRNDPFNSDIYAQHLAANGTVWPGWPATGLAVSAATGDQDQPTLARDASGGAYVAWHDYRSLSTADIYLQRLSAAGIAPGWPANGLGICVQPGDQGPVNIAADGVGGVYLAWHDGRNLGTTSYDIYMQRVNPAGMILWASNGAVICNAAGAQQVPVLAATTFGATVIWNDFRTGGAGSDLYSQFVTPSGALYSPNSGNLLAGGSLDQSNPVVIATTQQVAVAAWEDHGSDAAGNISGSVIQSGIGGFSTVLLCAVSGAQTGPIMVSDGAAGAIVAWSDTRSGLGDVYAQRLGSNGQALWPTGGLFLSVFNGSNEITPAAVADLRGGALVSYTRTYGAGTSSVNAGRADHFGVVGSPEPVITSARDVAADQGGLVHLTWDASYLDADPAFGISSYNVWRRVTTNAALLRLRDSGARILGPQDRLVGKGPALRTIPDGLASQTWEFLGTLPARGYGSYAFPAATLADSVSGATGYTVFMVDAEGATAPAFWSSNVDSGYSVDNLAPNAPAALAGNYSAGATHLHWLRNGEADLAGYRLYRGTSAAFVPSPANLVATPPDTGYADAGAAGRYYKLSAVDVHGNESGFAALTPDQTVDVAGDGTVAFALDGPRPNPSTGARLSVSFALPSNSTATLDLIDLAGRRVRSVDVGALGSGRHVVDVLASGRLAPGLYFLRLRQGGHERVERVTLLP
jgi:hypothetical protein